MRDLDFGISSGGAFIKYDARAGAFKVTDAADQEVTLKALKFAVDHKSIDSGWLAFVKGEGAKFVSGLSSAKPESVGGIEYRQGVRFNVFGAEVIDALGEALGLREIASTALYQRSLIVTHSRIPIFSVL